MTTNELRWFYPGAIPENVQVWFEQNCLIDKKQAPQEREDWYLYSPECDYLGIKLRQGRLEVKWRKAEFGTVRFGELVEGKVEKWHKWLCEDSTGESFQPAMVLENSVWVNVQKVRHSQLYQVLPDFSAQPVISNEQIDNGCSVEITELRVENQAWWSLAFEAFGEDARLLENLRLTTSRVFNTYRWSKLLAADSYAYPHWLKVIRNS
ncbi:MAG: hypothetical protein KME21_11970 [Desmonostoc vinosum HA7617-LM4]|jgi:hypothetical protein|nr:hypothetical protein [Desmonostoc vinosum HA7617-LM4]